MTSVRPSSSTRDRTPRVEATVRDDCAELTRDDITFALDGQPISTFSYDVVGPDRFVYDSGRLPLGRHTVRITATDDASNTAKRIWTSRSPPVGTRFRGEGVILFAGRTIS